MTKRSASKSSGERSPMSRAQRRQLVVAPFNALGVRRFSTSYPWGGVMFKAAANGGRLPGMTSYDGDITKFAVGDFMPTEEELEALA